MDYKNPEDNDDEIQVEEVIEEAEEDAENRDAEEQDMPEEDEFVSSILLKFQMLIERYFMKSRGGMSIKSKSIAPSMSDSNLRTIFPKQHKYLYKHIEDLRKNEEPIPVYCQDRKKPHFINFRYPKKIGTIYEKDF